MEYPGADNSETSKKLIDELNEMFRTDQEYAINPTKWNSPQGIEIRNKHTQRLKDIIKDVGWPSISMVGPIPASNAWIIAQHSDHDLEFQKSVLEILKSLPEGEVNRVNLAMLEDRVRVNQKQPQVFGTQWTFENGKRVPFPIEDPENVEQRRKDYGLLTLEEDRLNMEEWDKKSDQYH